VVHASERSEPGTIFDLLAHTVRTGFDKWPWPRWWRPFVDTTPQIVYLRRNDDPAVPANPADAAPADDALADDALNALRVPVRGFHPIVVRLKSEHIVPDGPEAAAGVPLLGLLKKASTEFNRQGVRNSRLLMVWYLATMHVSPHGAESHSGAFVRQLRAVWPPGADDSSARQPGLVERVLTAGPPPLPMIAPLAGWLGRQVFWLRFRGIPGFGDDWRWLRRRWEILEPDQAFRIFALNLTPGEERLPAETISLLAAWAFLEDIRQHYRPRLWRRRTWLLGRRPALVLSRLEDSPPGRPGTKPPDRQPPDQLDRQPPDRLDHKLAELILQVREQSGQAADPLLVVMAGQPRPSFANEEVTIAQEEPARLGRPAEIVYPRAKRPWLALPLLTAVFVMLGALTAATTVPLLNSATQTGGQPPRTGDSVTAGTSTLATSPSAASSRAAGPPTRGCLLSENPGAPSQGKEWKAGPHDEECVGYSSTDALVFSNLYPYGSREQQAQDKRVIFDERRIFAENKTADHLAALTGRTEVGLVYFAGITEGSAEDFDSAQGEELEGLLAAQTLANVPGGTAPLLKIVVANGGSKMQEAAYVAHLLLPLFAGNSNMLGVVGLDRSTGDVLNAIGQFVSRKIPVLATTLSADNFADIGEYYFSLSPTNSDEAKLILNYIVHTVTRYFAQPASSYFSAGQVIPTRVTVYEPPDTNAANSDDPDYYLNNLVSDLTSYAPKILSAKTRFQVTDSHLQSALCGAATVDIYAGRHDRPANAKPGDLDDFGNFMEAVNGCAKKPFVIGDDGVTRFIADPAARDEGLGGDWPISYVSKGLAVLATGTDCLSEDTVDDVQPSLRVFCGAYAGIATELKENVARVQLPWTGERAGIAYDAAEMFLHAENAAGHALTRIEIPGEFETITYSGVTGTVSFSPGDHVEADSPDGMPLAIVRIPLSNSDALPVCAVTSATAAYGLPSDTLPNPKTCLHGQF
jgi:hypothetical protein